MGELGEMGRVQIPRPRGDKLPFTCFITFSSPPSTRIQVYQTQRRYPFPLLLVLEYIYIRPRGQDTGILYQEKISFSSPPSTKINLYQTQRRYPSHPGYPRIQVIGILQYVYYQLTGYPNISNYTLPVLGTFTKAISQARATYQVTISQGAPSQMFNFASGNFPKFR